MCAYTWKFVAVVIHLLVVLSHTVVVLDCLPLFTLTLFFLFHFSHLDGYLLISWFSFFLFYGFYSMTATYCLLL